MFQLLNHDGVIHRLNTILRDLKISQTRIAELTGIPKSSISEICSGKKELRQIHIEQICKALEIPVWYLFQDPEKILEEEEKEILELFRSLTTEEKRGMLTILKINKEHSEKGD